MVKTYTEIWNGFQIRDVVYLCDKPHYADNFYDLVLWQDCEPHEVTSWETGEKYISTKHCFSIGHLEWDEKEPGFTFHSCGLRYLEYRIDGLEDWITDWCEMMYEELTKESWDD